MIAINGIVVTEKMRKAGNSIVSDLYDAGIHKCMGGLGGCKNLDYSDFKANLDLIRKYMEDDIDSVQAIYIAMERAK